MEAHRQRKWQAYVGAKEVLSIQAAVVASTVHMQTEGISSQQAEEIASTQAEEMTNMQAEGAAIM